MDKINLPNWAIFRWLNIKLPKYFDIKGARISAPPKKDSNFSKNYHTISSKYDGQEVQATVTFLYVEGHTEDNPINGRVQFIKHLGGNTSEHWDEIEDIEYNQGDVHKIEDRTFTGGDKLQVIFYRPSDVRIEYYLLLEPKVNLGIVNTAQRYNRRIRDTQYKYAWDKQVLGNKDKKRIY